MSWERPLPDTLRDVASYHLGTDLAERLVDASRWQAKQSELMLVAADEIERLMGLHKWHPFPDQEMPEGTHLVVRRVNGQTYVDTLTIVPEPDSGLPPSPAIASVTHWMPLPKPPEA